MKEYTLCFIIQNNKILMLNRERAKWMGSWNGVGGKIEPRETPTSCIIREIKEETGISLHHVTYKGIINKIADNLPAEKIYLFLSQLPDNYVYSTPKNTNEGILDWKAITWILSPENTGVVKDIQNILPLLLNNDNKVYNFLCVFKKNNLIKYDYLIIDN